MLIKILKLTLIHAIKKTFAFKRSAHFPFSYITYLIFMSQTNQVYNVSCHF